MGVRLLVDQWDEPQADGGYRRWRRGDILDVSADTAAWLLSVGAAAHATEPEPSPVPESGPDTADEPVGPVDREVTAEPVPTGEPQRPKRAAPLKEWREYADALGVKTAGMNRAEIQAATQM